MKNNPIIYVSRILLLLDIVIMIIIIIWWYTLYTSCNSFASNNKITYKTWEQQLAASRIASVDNDILQQKSDEKVQNDIENTQELIEYQTKVRLIEYQTKVRDNLNTKLANIKTERQSLSTDIIIAVYIMLFITMLGKMNLHMLYIEIISYKLVGLINVLFLVSFVVLLYLQLPYITLYWCIGTLLANFILMCAFQFCGSIILDLLMKYTIYNKKILYFFVHILLSPILILMTTLFLLLIAIVLIVNLSDSIHSNNISSNCDTYIIYDNSYIYFYNTWRFLWAYIKYQSANNDGINTTKIYMVMYLLIFLYILWIMFWLYCLPLIITNVPTEVVPKNISLSISGKWNI